MQKPLQLPLHLPAFNFSKADTRVVNRYLESLGKLGELQHFSLTLHLPALNFRKADPGAVNGYLESLRRLERFRNVSLTLHLPDSGVETKKITDSSDSSSKFLHSKVSQSSMMFLPSNEINEMKTFNFSDESSKKTVSLKISASEKTSTETSEIDLPSRAQSTL